MPNPRTAVIIPNWNGQKLLAACLDSLGAQRHTPQIIVVDNGSSDGSVQFIETRYPQVQLVKLTHNQGFAGGVNAGIKHALAAGVSYIGLLNNDAVADSAWLEQLVAVLDNHPKVGIVTAKILHADKKTIDSTGEAYSTWGTPFPRGRDETDEGQYDQQPAVLGASGAASLYRAVVLKQVGLFDEAFFAYYEDVDLSLRAQLSGWQIAYCPQARAYHQISATSSRLSNLAEYHQLKNYVYLYLKNMPGVLFWKYWLSSAVGFWGRSAVLIGRGKLFVVLRAWSAILLHLPTLLLQRRQIQSHRRMSPREFDALLTHQPAPTQKQRLKFKR